MDTNVILKYRRECDSWICPECDLENPATVDRCSVCGCMRPIGASLLKAWSEADERPIPPPRKVPPVGVGRPPKHPRSTITEPIFKDYDEYIPPEQPESNVATGIVWGIIIAIVILALVFILSNSGNIFFGSTGSNEYWCMVDSTTTLPAVQPEEFSEISSDILIQPNWNLSERQAETI